MKCEINEAIQDANVQITSACKEFYDKTGLIISQIIPIEVFEGHILTGAIVAKLENPLQ